MIRACSAPRPIFWKRLVKDNNDGDQDDGGGQDDNGDQDGVDWNGRYLVYNIRHSDLVIKLDIDQSWQFNMMMVMLLLMMVVTVVEIPPVQIHWMSSKS